MVTARIAQFETLACLRTPLFIYVLAYIEHLNYGIQKHSLGRADGSIAYMVNVCYSDS